jgi:hypothetical protein
MMYQSIRRFAVIAVLSCFANFSMAQDPDPGPKDKPSTEQKPEAKPFRVLTNGQRITIQSTKDISKIIVWTSSGNRFVEQTNVDASTYNFTVPSNEKIVFMMLELEGGKRYTKKIGVQ